ncbi:MAG TPA: TlpA disulfide reductase family protein [Chthonomonadaceae bacterium]|nr:TlpA disulfide reductase family protein [Chthonomonadaceae bacterium]
MLRTNPFARTAAAILPVAALGLLAAHPAAAQSASKFTLDPQGTKAARIGYFPVQVKLSDDKPAGVTKEPAYAGKPRYGKFTVGNGPKAAHYLAVDEPEGGTWKVYVDLNGDGDLTSSGDGAWLKKNQQAGRVVYGVNSYNVRASWGSPSREASTGDYGVAFYRIVANGANAFKDTIFMYREAARVGTVKVGDRTHKAMLVENDADGLYSKPLGDDGKPVSGAATRPVWLLIDLNDDGKFSSGPIDVRSPFKVADKAFEAKLSEDGARVALAPTTRKVPDKPAAPVAKPLLAAGTAAPDFEAEAWGGGTLRLSDYKGKVVVLDFWATWCGPCQKSMPHIEKVYQAYKNKDVVVLGVCVWDDKDAYMKWVPEKKDTYHFKFAFDPAGRAGPKNIAGDKFNVSGIPTTYVIDRDGKVSAAIVGYSDGDTRVEDALAKLGLVAPVAN